MSERLIVEARGVPMDVALRIVSKVVEQGRISGDGRSYCYLATGSWDGGDLTISAKRNRASDTLVVEAA